MKTERTHVPPNPTQLQIELATTISHLDSGFLGNTTDDLEIKKIMDDSWWPCILYRKIVQVFFIF